MELLRQLSPYELTLKSKYNFENNSLDDFCHTLSNSPSTKSMSELLSSIKVRQQCADIKKLNTLQENTSMWCKSNHDISFTQENSKEINTLIRNNCKKDIKSINKALAQGHIKDISKLYKLNCASLLSKLLHFDFKRDALHPKILDAVESRLILKSIDPVESALTTYYSNQHYQKLLDAPVDMTLLDDLPTQWSKTHNLN